MTDPQALNTYSNPEPVPEPILRVQNFEPIESTSAGFIERLDDGATVRGSYGEIWRYTLHFLKPMKDLSVEVSYYLYYFLLSWNVVAQ